ncbi:hypothetical protein DL240_10010 [Lujinxingia litoralis]|uniref:Uncharacterized protein n=1 Tax=Lujinxingia litoralis TaxID=2211119 RepID=A0A328C716_9DELT|nr:hypothetical protein [Lujinxingia litoralis]RAL22180.1 hypothetical protein DL240_10010 [Lujinxingia litoralis]
MKMLKRASLLTAALAVTAPASLALAQQADPLPETYSGVRATGMGNALTPIAAGVDSLYHNPAGLARGEMYILDGAFTYTPQGGLLSAGIADSKTNPQIAAGVSYSYYFGAEDHADLSGHDVRAAAAVPVIPERISLGVGGRYMHYTDSSLPEDPDNEDSQVLFKGFTVDVGAMFRVTEFLHLGINGQNLIDPCRNDARCRGAAPTRIGGGFGLGTVSTFHLTGQAFVDISSAEDPLFDFGVGAEYVAAGAIPLRLGFERQGFFERNLITAGFGWRSQAAGLDLSYRHDLNQSSSFGYISGGFSVYF